MYNISMENNASVEKCNRNPVRKIIRIILSLFVIGMGIYFKNPIGLLGLLTLYTAFSGNCGLKLTFYSPGQRTSMKRRLSVDPWEPGSKEK